MSDLRPISIEVRDLQKLFGPNRALDGVTIRFDSSLMHGVIGPEGAGKTTLMRVMLGLMRASSGSVHFFRGEEEARFEDIHPEIAYMPQQQSLYPDLSIGEHLDFFRELYGIPEETYRKRREELLSITRLSQFVARPAGQLSGGMYKK